jgi:hypothetical protein
MLKSDLEKKEAIFATHAHRVIRHTHTDSLKHTHSLTHKNTRPPLRRTPIASLCKHSASRAVRLLQPRSSITQSFQSLELGATHTHTCTYTHTHTHTIYVCMCTYMYMCGVCVCVFVYIYHKHIHIHVCVCVCVCACVICLTFVLDIRYRYLTFVPGCSASPSSREVTGAILAHRALSETPVSLYIY